MPDEPTTGKRAVPKPHDDSPDVKEPSNVRPAHKPTPDEPPEPKQSGGDVDDMGGDESTSVNQ